MIKKEFSIILSKMERYSFPKILLYASVGFVHNKQDLAESRIYIYSKRAEHVRRSGTIIANEDISDDEIINFLKLELHCLKGASIFEILSKGNQLYEDFDTDYDFECEYGFNTDANTRGWTSQNKYQLNILEDIQFVSAQKGNGFYHEDDVLDLATWQPEAPDQFELYMRFEILFKDGSREPIFITWASDMDLIRKSWERYQQAHQAKIFKSYPFFLHDTYDLEYFKSHFDKNTYRYSVQSKEEALVKYNYMGFDVENIKELMTQVIGKSDTVYCFDGNIDIKMLDVEYV